MDIAEADIVISASAADGSILDGSLTLQADELNVEATDFDLSNVTNIILSSTYSGIDTIVAIGSYHYRFVKGILVERY
jgi:hypothetical protein